MGKILSSISLIALTIINDLQVGKFKQRGVSVQSTIKTIPVAVMLAMSPMVTQAQTQATLPEGTTVFEPKNPRKPLRYLDAMIIGRKATVLKNVEFKNAAPRFGDCTVSFLSTDDDNSNAEMVGLTFEKKGDLLEFHALLYPERFVIDKDGYFIQGNGIYQTNEPGNMEKIYDHSMGKISIHVNRNFFEYMYAVAKDDLPLVVNSKEKITCDF